MANAIQPSRPTETEELELLVEDGHDIVRVPEDEADEAFMAWADAYPLHKPYE